MAEYYQLGFERKPEHLQFQLVNEPKKKSDFTETETLARLDRYSKLVQKADEIERTVAGHKKAAFYQLVLYPVRAAKLANERYFAAQLAESSKAKWLSEARYWAQRSINADQSIATETLYYNQALSNGKWRGMMSPEMNVGQWPSMRAFPPKLSITDFPAGGPKKPLPPNTVDDLQNNLPASASMFRETGDVISIEAENFQTKTERNGFGWSIIDGLGKTGDSISVFPSMAKTFYDLKQGSPALEYEISADGGEYTIEFYLLPTQPLATGKGLRLAFAIDDAEPQIVIADADTEVSSRKWAANILDQTTRAIAKRAIPGGRHRLRVFAVDTGVVLDKIVLYQKDLPLSYFGPAETRVGKAK